MTCVQRKRSGRKPEQIRHVGHLIVRQRAERDPAEHQRKRDRHRQHAAPEQDTGASTSAERERWRMKVCATRLRARQAESVATVPRNNSGLPEQFPAAIPVDARRRFVEPHVVVVDDAPCGEDHREGVDHQRGIEILQIARTDHDRSHQQAP